MTDKETRFVDEYLIDLNATQAAIRAGYSENAARQIGSETLSKPYIQEAIQAKQKVISERNEVTIDSLISELKSMAFVNTGDFFNEGWEAKDVTELTEAQKRAIQSVKKTKVRFGGEGESERETFEFRLHSKLDAIEKLAKHIGFYEKDNSQTRAFNVIVNSADEAEKLRKI